jgi:hypothetical protein
LFDTVSRGLVVFGLRGCFAVVLDAGFGVFFRGVTEEVFGLVVFGEVEDVFFEVGFGERKIPLLLPKS